MLFRSPLFFAWQFPEYLTFNFVDVNVFGFGACICRLTGLFLYFLTQKKTLVLGQLNNIFVYN